MQYLGGKSRISSKISEVINNALSRWEKQNSKDDFEFDFRERERERVM